MVWLTTHLSMNWVSERRQPSVELPSRLVMSTGSSSNELAKMIGMTPDWLTFNGMYVLCPPYMRRPTTRLANWTGMRRWPSST